jgi:hypothetical protein
MPYLSEPDPIPQVTANGISAFLPAIPGHYRVICHLCAAQFNRDALRGAYVHIEGITADPFFDDKQNDIFYIGAGYATSCTISRSGKVLHNCTRGQGAPVMRPLPSSIMKKGLPSTPIPPPAPRNRPQHPPLISPVQSAPCDLVITKEQAVYINGEKIGGVTSIEFEVSPGGYGEVTMTFIPSSVVSGDQPADSATATGRGLIRQDGVRRINMSRAMERVAERKRKKAEINVQVEENRTTQ